MNADVSESLFRCDVWESSIKKWNLWYEVNTLNQCLKLNCTSRLWLLVSNRITNSLSVEMGRSKFVHCWRNCTWMLLSWKKLMTLRWCGGGANKKIGYGKFSCCSSRTLRRIRSVFPVPDFRNKILGDKKGRKTLKD